MIKKLEDIMKEGRKHRVDHDLIANLWTEGRTVVQISKEAGCSDTHVRTILRGRKLMVGAKQHTTEEQRIAIVRRFLELRAVGLGFKELRAEYSVSNTNLCAWTALYSNQIELETQDVEVPAGRTRHERICAMHRAGYTNQQIAVAESVSKANVSAVLNTDRKNRGAPKLRPVYTETERRKILSGINAMMAKGIKKGDACIKYGISYTTQYKWSKELGTDA